MLLDKLAGFFAAAIGQATCEDERLACKFVALYLALFRCGMHARLVKFLDELAIGGLGEKLGDGSGNFRADFVNCHELLFVCRCQFFE